MTADISAVLNTPFNIVRKTPILLFLRMHEQVQRIVKLRGW